MRRQCIALAIVLTAACTTPSIEWGEPTALSDELSAATDLAFAAPRRLVARPAPPIAPPPAAGQCRGSARVSGDSIGGYYAVWWSIRADSSAGLVVAFTPDGIAWRAPMVVDTLDAGRTGCRRPPPSIAADGANVHVAYSMTAREGPGIFASHSMDQGKMFHSPVAVVYGERIGLTSIAARGDIVAVAYEDPNSDPPRIGLALSRTMAHLFQSRILVSPPTGAARAPAVALGEREIAVAWTRGTSGATGQRMMRLASVR